MPWRWFFGVAVCFSCCTVWDIVKQWAFFPAYPVSAAGGRSYKVIFGKNAESLSLKGDSER
jgi:hypothetical protein